jgi:hypothetical protein
MHSGGANRASIFRQLAGDDATLGGQAGVCRAYTNLFVGNAIFSFAAVCRQDDSCAGAPQHFCPSP